METNKKDIEQESNSEEILDVSGHATSQKNSTVTASQPKKKRTKSAKETAAKAPISPVESPQGKLTISATKSCIFAKTVQSLCNCSGP